MKIIGKNILVTGGAGFIGSHLVDRLIKEQAKSVIVIDNMFLGNIDNLRHAFSRGAILYKDDAESIFSLEYIIKKHNINIVFNCATKALNYSFVNPFNACETNIKVMLNLLELQRRKHFKTLCHFSSSEAYGTAIYEPMDESHPLSPLTAYAAGKASADIILKSYVSMFDLDSYIIRPFNNYGERQNFEGAYAGVIPATIHRIINRKPPEICGTGEQARDFIYVGDTIDAVIKVLDKLKPGESVNISAFNKVKIKDLIHKIMRIMGYTGKVVTKRARMSDVQCHLGCNDKLKSLINFKVTSFDVGLKKTIDWYKKLK